MGFVVSRPTQAQSITWVRLFLTLYLVLRLVIALQTIIILRPNFLIPHLWVPTIYKIYYLLFCFKELNILKVNFFAAFYLLKEKFGIDPCTLMVFSKGCAIVPLGHVSSPYSLLNVGNLYCAGVLSPQWSSEIS